MGAGAGSGRLGENSGRGAPRIGWNWDYGATVRLSGKGEVLLDGWWSVRLGAVVSWENGSNRGLRVIECRLDDSGLPRLLIVYN